VAKILVYLEIWMGLARRDGNLWVLDTQATFPMSKTKGRVWSKYSPKKCVGLDPVNSFIDELHLDLGRNTQPLEEWEI
jgi:hypothetical protein